MTNKEISEHVKSLAINILSRSINDVVFSEQLKERCHEMAIYQTGIATELLIKAKLISVKPALIFSNFSEKDEIEIDDLSVIESKTIKYSELLKALSKIVEIKGDYSKEFERFGKLRNLSLHLGYNKIYADASFEVLKFIFETLIPLLYEAEYFDEEEFIEAMYLWDETMISDGYLIERAQVLKIKMPKVLMKELKRAKYV